MPRPQDWIMGEPPKDGETYMGWLPSKGAAPVHWSGWGGGVWDNETGHHLSDEPLFWMPMPVDPTQEMISEAFDRRWTLNSDGGGQ
ncbi:hypothetical protein NLU14_08880 [Marinobacter sp. 71-i]|uniref:DUF551 domain-containing protein n=1 Tax=Marinobacter iranensis TaxID=2962607 RepID=A0ABT5Y9I8_9GAMM|nr:hypothetical protein [Marinobacter iranensis]MDF0750344.1 hypothetical protein [Marinobacter iranensis]